MPTSGHHVVFEGVRLEELFAIDVDSGRQLWRYDAEKSIRNNAIAIGQGRVFLIDRALAEGDLLSNAAARRGSC